MRPAPLAAASSILFTVVSFCFAACSGGSGQPASSSGGGPNGSSTAPAGSGAPSATAASSGAAPADPVQACVATPAVQATCEGLGVMQNGGAPGDAGPSGRLQSVCDLVKSHRDAFRCCFDLWSKDHPGVAAKVTVSLELSHEGTLKAMELDKAKSSLTEPGFEKCMAAVAGSLKYPESPTGKLTRYSHAFDFKAKP